jgi:membrane-bound inhibitor of C-type lysozyme
MNTFNEFSTGGILVWWSEKNEKFVMDNSDNVKIQ